MKNIILIILLFFLIISCSKSEETAPESPYYFSCKINGTLYTVKGETNAYATLKTPDTYWIYGKEVSTNKEVYVRVNVNQGVGTVQMSPATKGQGSFFDTDQTSYNTNFNNGSGEITIIEKTPSLLKGKFSFVGNSFSSPIKKALVTEGEFNVLIK